jgi:hypothetical protein
MDNPARPTTETPATPLKTVSLAAVLAAPEQGQRYLWEGILPVGGLSLLAAKPKAGKSALARYLMLCVARGQPRLGRATTQGSVLYLALDERRDAVAQHFATLGAKDEPVHCWFGPVSGEPLETLRLTIRDKAASLAVVDPLIRLARFSDTNNYSEVSHALEPFTRLALDTGCHILLLHHLGKRAAGYGDAILGSTALFATVDTALLLHLNGDSRVLSSIQRYGPGFRSLRLAFDPHTGTFQEAADQPPPHLDAVKQSILELLSEQMLTEPEIKRKVGGDQVLCARALRELLELALVDRTGKGTRGFPFVYSCSPASFL